MYTIINLSDTIKYMESADFKDRFIAEYAQLKIRLDKLIAMVEKHKNGVLEFTPICPIEILEKQIEIMEEYLEVLKQRALIEHIKL